VIFVGEGIFNIIFASPFLLLTFIFIRFLDHWFDDCTSNFSRKKRSNLHPERKGGSLGASETAARGDKGEAGLLEKN
jgi:hypothetical protein